MKIVVLGGGPAGLYLALLARKADPTRELVVIERNAPDDTFGWGVVFSDQTLGRLRDADPESYEEIRESFAHWDDIDVHFGGHTITSGGHGFSGIGRARLLQILQRRAAELGVEVRYRTEVLDPGELESMGLGGADLVVAADGVNSLTRARYAERFSPDLDVRGARYMWLGTTRLFDAFTFIVVVTEQGVFQVHAYRFDERHSAFIVECDERSWRGAGFDRMSASDSVAACEALFARWLDGHPLINNAPHLRSPWVSFVRVRCERWWHRPEGSPPVVLIGDAAHTAHFSIGSGTKLALEDAIELAARLDDPEGLERGLEAYQEERRTEALRLQNAARNSMEWFENVRRYVHLPAEQFAYALLTRSQRVSHENLRLRDSTYLESVERWWASEAERAAGRAPRRRDRPPPPMFTPFRLRGLELHNRVVVSPMDTYSAVDGLPDDFHLVHLGGLALGGAALVMTEMTCVSPEGRISLGCTGMYTDAHLEAWRRIATFVHERSPAKLCLQLGHSGRKGSAKRMWEGMDEPLDDEGWEVVGPSPLPWAPGSPVPRAITRAEMTRVREAFVRATRMAAVAGFDMLELHCAHGYLLSSFLTPVSNQRDDEYGGSLENRLRYPLEVFRAMREVWPAERPFSVRVSATDWVDDGISPDDSVEIARAFAMAGSDVIHVSTGQTAPNAEPVFGRMFQTPYSDRIRNEARVPTIAVGNITEPDQVNGIIASGRADLCALGRPHLSDPRWTLHAAAELGYAEQWWPIQYQPGKVQLERQVRRRRESSDPAAL